MAQSEIKKPTVKEKKWKCNGAKQSSTKLFQGKVVERKVQDEVIKSEKKKKTGYRVTQKVWSSAVIKQGGHGNVTAAENKKKKNTENIKLETDQDTTHTSTTCFGKQTVNKGYELKPENSGTSKQIKRKCNEKNKAAVPLRKFKRQEEEVFKQIDVCLIRSCLNRPTMQCYASCQGIIGNSKTRTEDFNLVFVYLHDELSTRDSTSQTPSPQQRHKCQCISSRST